MARCGSIALAEPDRCAVAVTHSAMILSEAADRRGGSGLRQLAAFHRVFGDPIDPQLWAASDLLELANAAASQAGAGALARLVARRTATGSRPAIASWSGA